MRFLYPLIVLAAAVLILAYAMYVAAFRRGRENDFTKKKFPPESKYSLYRESIWAGVGYVEKQPCERVSVRSHDGLTLRGRFYPVEGQRAVALLFHGWRSVARNDFCCALGCFQARGISVLLADERAHGESEGRTITFGVKERRDVLTWADWATERFPGRKLILSGISMGAATVLMATALPLPESVCGVIADCGYTSPRAIIEKVIGQSHMPPSVFYPLVRLGARLFGGFDPEECSPVEAMRHCALPVLFIHGEADGFVPCNMGRENFAACASAWKKLVTVPGADHGFSYVTDTAAVQKGLDEFLLAVL